MARYYNPDTGVFLSRDPVRGDAINPLTLNGYNYANNNPVMNVDPNGEFVQFIPMAVYYVYVGYQAYKKIKYLKYTVSAVANFIKNAPRIGSALKSDTYHRAASWATLNQLKKGKISTWIGKDGTRYVGLKTKGSVNGSNGIFEYI
ncbi:RHS repeat-associated core domain-containing protein [Lysinibacillus sp. JNUCC 51]|uniref:RHS repeat-associated core domain-containing protein n=1 Tax=Lysinibacillus sp. JNUCC-51 TaxID=2792479 RepID=UPI003081803C